MTVSSAAARAAPCSRPAGRWRSRLVAARSAPWWQAEAWPASPTGAVWSSTLLGSGASAVVASARHRSGDDDRWRQRDGRVGRRGEQRHPVGRRCAHRPGRRQRPRHRRFQRRQRHRHVGRLLERHHPAGRRPGDRLLGRHRSRNDDQQRRQRHRVVGRRARAGDIARTAAHWPSPLAAAHWRPWSRAAAGPSSRPARSGAARSSWRAARRSCCRGQRAAARDRQRRHRDRLVGRHRQRRHRCPRAFSELLIDRRKSLVVRFGQRVDLRRNCFQRFRHRILAHFIIVLQTTCRRESTANSQKTRETAQLVSTMYAASANRPKQEIRSLARSLRLARSERRWHRRPPSICAGRKKARRR